MPNRFYQIRKNQRNRPARPSHLRDNDVKSNWSQQIDTAKFITKVESFAVKGVFGVQSNTARQGRLLPSLGKSLPTTGSGRTRKANLGGIR